MRGLALPGVVGILCALVLVPAAAGPEQFGVLGVLIVAPAVGLLFGAINGFIIVAGRLRRSS